MAEQIGTTAADGLGRRKQVAQRNHKVSGAFVLMLRKEQKLGRAVDQLRMISHRT